MFSSNSSSFHIINADKPMSRLRRFLYFPLNRINNRLPWRRSDILTLRKFTCKYLAEHEYFFEKDSPSRRLSNLFWVNLPWESMQREVGDLQVFDTGCGKGEYGLRFQNWSGNRLRSYSGMDFQTHESWQTLQKEYPFIHLIQGDAAMVDKFIPEKTNVFVTQSALEHIEMDILYFRRIHEFIMNRRRSVIQIHLFPSPACLDLYDLHGVRQYTPRTISRIVKIFESDSYAVLYLLGGPQSNSLHLNYITIPTSLGLGDLRDSQTQAYKTRLKEAIESDMANQNGQDEPSFYALVIHSFFNQKIF